MVLNKTLARSNIVKGEITSSIGATNKSVVEGVLDSAKSVTKLILPALKFIYKIGNGINKELQKLDVAAEGLVRMLDFQEQLRFSLDHNLKLNRVSIEMMGITLRRLDKQLDLSMAPYANIVSFENFQGSDIKTANYTKLSMESIGSFIKGVFNKIADFFSGLWDKIKEGFSKTFDVVGFMEKKFDIYNQAVGNLGDPTKDEFEANKSIKNAIPHDGDYTLKNLQEQYNRQVEAFKNTHKFTKEVSRDIESFDVAYRKSGSDAISKMGDSLRKLSEYEFGSVKEPLAGNKYFQVRLIGENDKHINFLIEPETGKVDYKDDAKCKTLTSDEIETLNGKLKDLLKTNKSAYDVYKENLKTVEDSIKSSKNLAHKYKDKEQIREGEALLKLFNGIYAICPALSYLIVATNLTYIEGCFDYIDESLKSYL